MDILYDNRRRANLFVYVATLSGLLFVFAHVVYMELYFSHNVIYHILVYMDDKNL